MRVCSGCGEAKPLAGFQEPGRARCKECRAKQRRDRYDVEGEQRREVNRQSYVRHKESRTRGHSAYNLALKLAVIAAYGGSCVCCGVNEAVFLTVDHVNEDGALHRRQLAELGDHFYLWLKRQGFPAGFQLMCFNCNWAKSHGGCPHMVKLEVLP